GPVVMLEFPNPAGTANSVIAPEVVIRPIRNTSASVNQSAPSGPAVIPCGLLFAGSTNSLTTPAVVILPMRSPLISVNHSAPSGPAVISTGPDPAVRPPNSVTTPAGVIRPMPAGLRLVNQRLPSGPAVMLMGETSPVVIGNSANFVFVFFAHTPSDCRQSATSMQPTRT